MPEMTKSWQNSGFYAPDLLTGVDVGMPPFKNSLSQELKSWSWRQTWPRKLDSLCKRSTETPRLQPRRDADSEDPLERKIQVFTVCNHSLIFLVHALHLRLYKSSSILCQLPCSRKDPGGYEDLAELDQALFLYINSQDQQSVQEQPQTLNIFPSRPMHVVAEPSPKAATSTSNIVAASSNLKPQRPPSKQSAMTAPGGKATVKREGSGSGGAGTPSTSEHEGPRTPDAKTLRRLAQNREAARKSRLRKKAYIQNLETSRVRLSQMEQEMQRCSAQLQHIQMWTCCAEEAAPAKFFPVQSYLPELKQTGP
uniref:Transcription factor HBP-1b(C38) n=1 Tax=Aegilops tauschii TaxID=37682 RepID=R7W916_AEGTA